MKVFCLVLLLAVNSLGVADRSLFELASPYDSQNEHCQALCLGEPEAQLVPSLNECPPCGPIYTSEHCNSCCFDGASSLKLRWHGCPGEVSLVSPSVARLDCSLTNVPDPSDAVRFVDCDCYDQLVIPGSGVDCELFRTFTLPLLDGFLHAYDVCLVSVQGDDSFLTVDLSVALPFVIGFDHAPSVVGFEPSTTYFDTTCAVLEDHPYTLPIFPGYGKFLNSCKSDNVPGVLGDLLTTTLLRSGRVFH